MKISARALGLAVGGALGAALLAGCSSDADRSVEHMEKAEAYLAEGKSHAAVLELRNALKADPSSAEICHRLAEALRIRGLFADAAFYYKEAMRLDPTRIDDALSLAELIRVADPEGALALIDGVLAKEPELPLAHVRRAQVHLVRGDLGPALEAASQAASLSPDDARAQIQLGIVHQARVKEARQRGSEPPEDAFAGAVDAFAAAMRAAGEGRGRDRAELERARTLSWWPGHETEAAQAFRGLVERAAASDARRLQRGAGRAAAEFARRSEDRELLLWALEHVVEADPGYASWGTLAALHDARDGSGEAVLRRLLEERRQHPLAHKALARYLVDRGSPEAAVAHLRDAIADGVPPLGLLATEAQLLFEMGRGEEARAAVATLQRDHAGRPPAELAIAVADVYDGRPDEAETRLERLLQRHTSWEGWFVLASAELAQRKIGQATDSIERARELAPSWILRVERLAARIHLSARRFADATLTLRAQRRMTGRIHPADRVLLVHALYGEKRERAGRRLLEQLLERDDPDAELVLTWARHERTRAPERTLELLLDLLEREPGHPAALRYAAELDLAEGRRAEAIARVDATLAADPPKPEPVRLLRALLLLDGGDAAGAERGLVDLVEREPPYGPAVPRLVALYASQGRVDAAIDTLRDRASRRTAHRLLLAHLHLRRGDHAEARALLEETLAERSDLPTAKNDLAWILASRGEELDRALQLAREAYQALDDDPAAADTLGLVFLRKGLHEAAASQFDLAVELAADAGRPDPLFHYHQGLALAALEQHERAAGAFERALALDPEFAEAPATRRALAASRRAARSPQPDPS